MSAHTGWSVCGSSNGHVLPGQEEDDTPITGGRIKKTHIVRAGVDQEEREMFQEEEEEGQCRRRNSFSVCHVSVNL